MKKNIFYLGLIIGFTIYGCKKSDTECDQMVKSSTSEIALGNIYYFHDFNYPKIIEYDIFKKYGFVDYLQAYPFSADSCFRIAMDKKIESTINSKRIFLQKEIESRLEQRSQTQKKQNSFKFSDSIYSPLGNVDFPMMKYPMYETEFRGYLIKTIKERFDVDFNSSSFWIVISKTGKIENIERYKKSSDTIDRFIADELKRSVWVPALNKADSTFVKSRIVFSLKN